MRAVIVRRTSELSMSLKWLQWLQPIFVRLKSLYWNQKIAPKC